MLVLHNVLPVRRFVLVLKRADDGKVARFISPCVDGIDSLRARTGAQWSA